MNQTLKTGLAAGAMLLAGAGIGTGVTVALNSSPPAPIHFSVTPPTCDPSSPNMTGVLSNLLNNPPPNGQVKITPGCYTVNGTIRIDSQSNESIDGTGVIFNKVIPGTVCMEGCDDQPMIWATTDTNFSITGLTLQGAWDGSSGNHGEHFEGYKGLETQDCVNCLFSNMAVTGQQGDGISVQFATASGVPSNAVNKNLTFANVQVINAGYTGYSIESVIGMTVSNGIVNGVAQNAVDMEVDQASTFFSGPGAQPANVVQNNITFTGVTWEDFNEGEGAWFVSEQGDVICNDGMPAACNTSPCPHNGGTGSTGAGSAPPQCTYYAVTQMHLTLTNNTIIGADCNNHPLRNPCTGGIDIIGTFPGGCCNGAGNLFPARVQNIGLTVTNNHWIDGTIGSINGGSANCWDGHGPPFSPACPTGDTMVLKNVGNVDIENNTFPARIDPSFGVFLAAFSVIRSQGLIIRNNNFDGAFIPLDPGSNSNTGTIIQCGNSFGPTGTTIDNPC